MPMFNHQANTEFMMSVIKLVASCLQNQIELVLYPICFESLIPRARNACVAHMLASDCTHLLFIDSDIEFDPSVVIRMLEANKEIVGVGYAQKWLNLDPFLTSQPNPLEICSKASVHLLDPTAPPTRLMEAKYITTGCMLVTREALTQMVKHYPERQYINDVDGYSSPDAANLFYNLFCCEISKDGRYESEDYGFSRLWTNMGGKIYVITDITLTHHGYHGYKANLYRQLQLAYKPT